MHNFIILINDKLSEAEEDKYVDFINNNIGYNGHINTSPEKGILATIENMSGIEGDDIFIVKDNKVVHRKVRF
jgi:hypothetical protein